MSKKRRERRLGCALEARHGKLRLRFRWCGPDGRLKQFSRATDEPDTAEGRAKLAPLAKLIGSAIEAGRDPLAVLGEVTIATITTPSARPAVPECDVWTVRRYYERWIVDKVPPEVRKAQAQDYRRHVERYVLPKLGDVALSELDGRLIIGLRSELRQSGLSLKYVKNILAGSFKAMIRDAREIDRLLTHDPFLGVRWPRVEVPGPEPLMADERQRVLAWFRDRRFSFHAGSSADDHPRRHVHPPYHAFLHLLFWTGMRPSEAAGLQWGDVDLDRGVLHIRRSRHLGENSATKTPQAQRTIELLPETVRVLRAIQPLRVEETTPVLLNTWGQPIEPRAFLSHWYACLRALGIRMRGLYATKDTYISTVLPLKAIPWIEEQTGVRYETLRRHYGKWLPRPGQDDTARALDQLAREGSLFPVRDPRGNKVAQRADLADAEKCRGGDSNPYTLTGWRF
jgi:integrase